MDHHDVIVIGAGAMGSAATYQLAKQGKDVLLLEQFEFLHNKGSSHGESRVIRKTYQDDYFARMMADAYDLWDKLQTDTGEQLITRTGGLDFGHRSNRNLQQTIRVAERLDIDHMLMDENLLKTRFPAFNFDDNSEGIYQSDAGIINADLTIKVLQNHANKHGAVLKDDVRITDIITGDEVEIQTAEGAYSTDQLILTTGSWINELLSLFYLQVDIKVWHLTYGFFKPTYPELYKVGKFPVFIDWDTDIYYGFPIHEKDGLIKIAPHQTRGIKKLSHRDEEILPDEKLLGGLKNYIAKRLDRVNIMPDVTQSCYYTMTDTEDFIIDYIPDHDNVIVAGGFSGHGFKFTPLIGKILADLATTGKSKWKLDKFKISNFTT